MKRVEELRKMSNEELGKKLKELKMELLRLNAERFGKRTLSNPGRYRELKKTVARIITILKERGLW